MGAEGCEMKSLTGIDKAFLFCIMFLMLIGTVNAAPTYYAWGLKDGHKIVEGYPTYLRWDGTFQSLASANINNGNWSYLREDFGTYWKITADGKSFRLPKKTWISYDFEPLKIKETMTIPTLQSLIDRSVVHNATTRYIPLDFSPSIAQTQIGNQLQLGRFKTGEFWIRDNGTNVFDNQTNETWRNYSYYDVQNHYRLVVVNGEIRLYFDDLIYFQNAKYPLLIDPTWEENSTTGCLGTLIETVCVNNQVYLNRTQTSIPALYDTYVQDGTSASTNFGNRTS